MSDLKTDKYTDIPSQLVQKLSQIKLLAMDVDGVLTDGKLYYSEQGELLKTFSIKDGLGIKLLRDCGVEPAIITGRRSRMVELRAGELGINTVIQGREDKLTALKELGESNAYNLDQIAYIGDDLPDLSAIVSCGFGATVADACQEVKSRADWISQYNGGEAAVRELAELILRAQGHFSKIIDTYLP